MTIRSATAILMAVGLAQAASAQSTVTLRLDRTEDLFGLLNNPVGGGNPFYVGTSLSCIETDGTPNGWFIGGINGATSNQAWNAAVVKIEFDFSTNPPTRAFRAIPSSQINNIANFSSQGYTGMDYLAGAGLLTAVDDNNDFSSHYKFYDVNTQLNPILVTNSAVYGGARYGSGSIAWDNSPTGAGYAYTYETTDPLTGETIINNGTGPLAAAQIFGDLGPRGTAKETLNFVSSAESANAGVASGLSYFIGNGGGLSGGIPGVSPAILPVAGNTLWRDLDIHPTTGVMVGRANNSVIFASRQPDNTTSTANMARVSIPAGGFPNAVGQRSTIMAGAPGGDLVAINNRNVTTAQSFASAIRFYQCPAVIDGGNPPAPVTPSFIDSTGAALSLPDGVGFYDFAWIPCTNQLLVMDCATGNANRLVYVFTVNPATPDAPVRDCNPQPPTCAPDFNGDGTLDPDDLADYIGAFFSVPAPLTADFNGDGIVDPDDLADYIGAYFAGCP